jgi:maleamate amidohydrolase
MGETNMNELDFSEMEKVYDKQELGKYRIGFGEKPALLIVDFQYGLTDSQYGFGGGNIPNAVQETARLLKHVHAKDVSVFYSAVAYRDDLFDGGHIIKKIRFLEKFVYGSRYVEIDQLVKPKKGDLVIHKKCQSFFAGTNLHIFLKTLTVDTVLIAGCTTSSGVRATAIDALAHGYRPIVIEECTGDRSLFSHKVSLMELNAKRSDVVKVQEVIEYLQGI